MDSVRALDEWALRSACELQANQPRADYTIGQLPVGISALTNDLIPVYRNGQTYSIPVSGLPSSTTPSATVAGGGGPVTTTLVYYASGGDDTLSIQGAVNALGAAGGYIYLPNALYKISAVVTVPFNNVHLYGNGPAATTIQQQTLALGHFALSMGVIGFELRDLALNYTTQATGGTMLALGNVSSCYLTRVSLNNGFTGIQMSGAVSVYLSQCLINFGVNANAGVLCTPTQSSELHFSDCVFNGTLGTAAAFQLQAANNVYIANCTVRAFGYGINAAPGTGQAVSNVQVVNSFFDGCGYFGLAVAPINDGSARVFSWRLSNTWFGSSGISGVNLQAVGALGVLDGFAFANCAFANNGSQGINISLGSKNVTLTGCHAFANGRVIGNGNGMVVTNSADQVSIIGGKSGNGEQYGVTQAYGVLLDQSTTNVLVIGLNAQNNLVMGFNVGLPNNSLKIIGCDGYNPVGSLGNITCGPSPFTIQNGFGVEATYYVTSTAQPINVSIDSSSNLGTGPISLAPLQRMVVTWSGAAPIYAIVGK